MQRNGADLRQFGQSRNLNLGLGGYQETDEGYPTCLLSRKSEVAFRILGTLDEFVSKHQYLPLEAVATFKKKFSLSSTDTKQIYFYILNRQKLQKLHHPEPRELRERSYGEYDISPKVARETSMISTMSISDVSDNLDLDWECADADAQQFLKRGNMDYDYTKRVYENLRFAEKKYSVKGSNILKKSKALTYEMRLILVDWLHEVSKEYDLKWQTLLLCIQIVDRYLNVAHCSKQNLQLLGVAAMWISAKMEEIHPPTVADFVYISDNAYKTEDVIRFESTVLEALNWNVTFPTCHDFLSHFQAFFYDRPSVRRNSEMFVDIFLQHKQYLHYSQSHVAAAALFLAVLYERNNNITWYKSLNIYSGFSPEDLGKCSREMNNAFSKCLIKRKHRAALQKHRGSVNLTRHVRWKILASNYFN